MSELVPVLGAEQLLAITAASVQQAGIDEMPNRGCKYPDGSQLYQITAPHMCVGFVAINGRVTPPIAPIISWMLGKQIGFIAQYCAKKRWSLVKVSVP